MLHVERDCVELMVSHDGQGGAAIDHRTHDLEHCLDRGTAVDEVAELIKAFLRRAGGQ